MDQRGIAPLVIVAIVVVSVVAGIGIYATTRGGTSGENSTPENSTPEQTFTIYSVEASTVTADGWRCLRTLIDGKTDGITYLSMQLPSGQWAYCFWNVEGGQHTGTSTTSFGEIDHIVIGPFDGTKVVDVFPFPEEGLSGQPPENGTYTAVIRTMDNIIYRKSLIISWS